MPEEENSRRQRHAMNNSGVSGGLYGLGFIGALVYFIQQATTFWMGVLGFFKAIFWPAVLIYKLLEYLKVS
ncbi:MAG TPA: hypothetical protein VMM37_10180 [Bacteroidota bacterium]|nr:hypothetical protein [Bacteroidota bacterium]